MKHTPTPYRVGTGYGSVVADIPKGADDRRIHPGHIKAYGGYIVAESCVPSDAVFIVEACNAYGGLKEDNARQERAIVELEDWKNTLLHQRDALLKAAKGTENDCTTLALLEAIALCEGEK